MTTVLTSHDYIRECYRGSAAYADGLAPELLDAIHIQTQLDKAVRKAVKAGNSIVLTGNPGDGKTHLLRILEKDIKKASPAARIEYDASESLNDEVVSKWKQAHRKKVPFCIAINEAVLKQLADDNPGFAPLVTAQSRVEKSITYHREGESPSAQEHDGVAVFDLSRRNVLSKDVVSSVIDTFVNADCPDVCKDTENDFAVHSDLIRTPLFQQRLLLLFERIVRRGFHCTLRELQGFVSYLLCRGLSCDKLAEESGQSDSFVTELLYKGRGPLFDALRQGFDPSTVCHPQWDVRLIASEVEPSQWTPGTVELIQAVDVEDTREAERRRRRFYFFHDRGIDLLSIAKMWTPILRLSFQ